MNAVLKAANYEVEPYWPGLFANALEGVKVRDLITNIGSGAAAPAAAAPAAAAAAPAAAKKEEKKEEKKKAESEEEDGDMGFGKKIYFETIWKNNNFQKKLIFIFIYFIKVYSIKLCLSEMWRKKYFFKYIRLQK